MFLKTYSRRAEHCCQSENSIIFEEFPLVFRFLVSFVVFSQFLITGPFYPWQHRSIYRSRKPNYSAGSMESTREEFRMGKTSLCVWSLRASHLFPPSSILDQFVTGSFEICALKFFKCCFRGLFRIILKEMEW